MKNGLKFDFSWLKTNGGRTSIKLRTLEENIHNFLSDRKKIDSLRKSTLAIYNRALNHFVECIGDMRIDCITLHHIDTFIDYSKCLSHAKTTININLRVIRTFLTWLFDRELINKVPKIKQLPVKIDDPRYITEIEYTHLMKLNHGHQRFNDMFKLYWETGMRLSEAFYGVINGNWLDVPHHLSKNGKIRSIRINEEQKETINLLQSVWQENGSTEDHIKWYSKKFKKGLLKIGVLDKHFHCLRHSFGARRIIETNGNIHLVRDEMGHSSVIVTERYTRLNRKRIIEDFPSLSEKIKLSENMLINGISVEDFSVVSQLQLMGDRREIN